MAGNTNHRATYQYRQGLQYVEHVPNFLKGLVAPRRPANPDGGSDDDDDAGAAKRRAAAQLAPEEALRADRPDRDDEAPQVVQLVDHHLSKEEVDRLLAEQQHLGTLTRIADSPPT